MASGSDEKESEREQKESEQDAKHQFNIKMKQVQSEASLGRVKNMHPSTRHKMKDQLEKEFEEKLSESPTDKKPAQEELWKVFQEKADKKKADKMERLRASFSASNSEPG